MKKPQISLPKPPEVAVCAYLIWEKQGRPPGRALTHWIQAEEQIQADIAHELGLLQAENSVTQSRRVSPQDCACSP